MSARFFAALVFALATALAVTEVVNVRHRRLTVRRARQQVGLLDADVDEKRRTLRGWSPRLVVASLTMALIGVAVAGPLGLVIAAVPVIAARSWSNRRRRRRQDALADELGPALQMIIGHLRIGRNVSAALVEVAESCTGPLREVLTEVVAEARLGSPLDEVLTAVAEREATATSASWRRRWDCTPGTVVPWWRFSTRWSRRSRKRIVCVATSRA